jgi:hypothetical protein
MSRMLVSIAALALIGAAALPISANAAERQSGISKAQSTDVSAQRHWRGRHYGYYGQRRYYGPRYGYGYQPYRRYGYDGYPYGYYRPAPLIGLGVGPFGLRVF